jgi:excisionase family DNA binding protein
MGSGGAVSLRAMTYTHEQGTLRAMVEVTACLSYSEAQRLSSLGRTKLWELVSAGEVEAAKIGGAVRISRRSLDEYMRRNSYVEANG